MDAKDDDPRIAMRRIAALAGYRCGIERGIQEGRRMAKPFWHWSHALWFAGGSLATNAVWFAVLVPVLFAFAAFAVDVSRWYVETERMQKAADFLRQALPLRHAPADLLQLSQDILFAVEQVVISRAVGAFDIFCIAQAREFVFELFLFAGL